MYNLANALTLTRILIVPFIFFAAYYHNYQFFLPLFIIGGISDALDGFVARYLNQTTDFGAILDPIADKIFICSWYFIFAFCDTPYILPVWFFILILIKELILFSGSFYIYVRKKNLKIVPSFWGKLLMSFYSLLVLVLLLKINFLVNLIIYTILSISVLVVIDYYRKRSSFYV